MVNKKTGGIALVFAVIAAGAFVNLKPPDLPQEGRRVLDELIQRAEGPGFSYNILSAERGTVQDLNTDLDSFSGFGGSRKPPGVCPPDEAQAQEEWCVILDTGVAASLTDESAHFLLHRQGQLWTVEQVPDSGVEAFRQVGCRRW